MKIISHSADADGRLSAFLVYKFAKEKLLINLTEENFIMTDYGKHDDIFSKISKDEEVFVCDFSFENGPEDMKNLLNITKNVTWIDHHESSIKKYGEFGKDIPGLRIVGTAACMLTWIYLFSSINAYDSGKNPREITQKTCEDLYETAPDIVLFVHDNDVWRHDYKESKLIKLALDAINLTSPIDDKWNLLYENDDEIVELCKMGKTIELFRDSIGKYACEQEGFEIELNNKKGFALNNVFHGSPWFGNLVDKYEFVCCFNFNGKSKEWSYSFYSNNEFGANCYEIAQSINPKGGGHYHAAGCSSEKFIF